MKGIFKLFPVAIAALAFVSCSDDLEGSGYSTKQIPDNALRFSIGSNSNMRAGFVGNVMAPTGDLQFRWVGGDVIRVYQNDLATWDKYTYAGAEFGTEDVFTPDGQNSLDSYSIGVYPADEVEGVYMDKNDKDIKHIQMDLPVAYDYQEGLDKDADGSAGYRCDMPMYGNITNKAQAVTEMNFLSAYVRIYLRDLPEDAKYIALVSEGSTANPTPFPLTGRFIADVPKTITASTVGGVETDNSPILLKDDKFTQTFGYITYARVNTTKFSTEASTDAAVKDSAAICFPVLANNSVTRSAGGTLQTYGKLTIYAWGDNTATAKTPDQVANWATEVGAGRAIKIAEREDWTPTRRRSVWVVRYTEPVVVDVDDYDPLLPGDLTDIIASKANTAITDVAFKIMSSGAAADATLHSSAGYERNHVTTLPAMKNGSNIIIDLEDASAELLTQENWTINGNDFTGTLILKQGALAGTSVPTSKIEINLPNADVQIIGKAPNDITNIDVQQCKTVTIGDPENATVTTVGATKTVVVRDGEAYVVTGATVPNLKTEDNLTNHTKTDVVNVVGGTITTLDNNTNTDIKLYGTEIAGVAHEAIINNLDLADVNGAIEIYSEGKASIGDLTQPANTATGGGLEFLTIKSKLTEETAGTLALATVAGNLNGGGADEYIWTAAQLQKIAAAAPTKNVFIGADEIDLNSLAWTGGAIAKNVYGNNHDATTDTWRDLTTPATMAANKRLSTATGKNVIKNLNIAAAAGNGLFSDIDASGAAIEIAGLEIENPAFTNTGVVAVNNIGVVAGTIGTAAANDIELTNIKVTGLTVASKAGNGVGGLVGAITAAQTGNVIVKNADVAATSIAARSFVGGAIGRVSAAVAAINIYDSKVNVSAVSLSLGDGASTLYPLYAGTWASFVGGTENNPVVALNIYDCNFGTALAKSVKGNGINNVGLRFGANADGNDVPFFGGNPWIGFCGTPAPASNTTLTSYKSVSSAAADKGKNFYKYVYAATQMVVTRWNGAGNYAETTQKNLNGGTTGGAGVSADQVTYNASTAAAVTASKVAGSHNWLSTLRYGTTIYSSYSDGSLEYDATYEPTSF